MTNTQTDGFPSRIMHSCPTEGIAHLQGTWLEYAEQYRAECEKCLTIIYWDEDGNTEVYKKEDTCNE